MEKLSGIDAAFLAVERSENPMNVMGTVVLRPAGSRREFIERILPEHLHRRLPLLAPLRRRLAPMPFGMGRPVWVEDRNFDCRDHIRNVRLGARGSLRELAAFVAAEAALPLHRSRPLWQLFIVEGLARKSVALVFKFHHAAVDGVSCAAMLGQLVDASPGSESDPGSPRPEPGSDLPTSAPALLKSEITQWPRRVRLLRDVLARGARASAESLQMRIRGGAACESARLFTAIPTPFNRKLSARRTVAYSSARRSDIRSIKRAFDTTTNDVVLAACTGALRDYLKDHGGIPSEPLIAAIPCSLRRSISGDTYGNQISAFLVRLPVHLEDGIEQLLAIRSETRIARAENGRVAGSHLPDWAELAPNGLLKLGGAVLGDERFLRHVAPLCNLVISNLPGPPANLTLAGARIQACYPHGPLIPGVGLNLTVISHGDTVDFGLLACERAVPEASDLALGFGAAVGRLRKLAMKAALAGCAQGARFAA